MMKLIALAAAGLVAATALTPVPAAAQRYGYGYDRGYHDGYGRDYRRNRHWREGRRWRGGRGWRGDRGYTRCRWVRGYYGRQRQCYRVYR